MKSPAHFTLTFLLSFLCLNFSYTQSLIPNGDFEIGPDSSAYGWSYTLSGCIIDGTIDGPTDWEVVSGSPDRLIETNIECDRDVDTACYGVAYVDFVFNEAGKTTLLYPLEKDSNYCLTYYAKWQHFNGSGTEPTKVTFNFLPSGNSFDSPYFDTPHVWSYHETFFTAESDGIEFEIVGTEDVSGGVSIDSIALKKVTPLQQASIESLDDADFARVYPNPFLNEITLEVPNQENTIFNLYNLNGDKMRSFIFNGTTKYDLSGFSVGVYFYELTQKGAIVSRGKIIKVNE